MTARNYWIGVVSRAHARLGVEGGFIQLNHGKKAPLQRFHAGDGLLIYSPKTAYPDGEALQAFTAVGIVKSGEIYQVEMSPDFKPYRVDVEFLPCEEASIRPLIEPLSFIKSKTHWGAAFRFGQVKVPAADFVVIAAAMGCRVFAEDER
ncbi:MAG: EVE domain-containing protein [Actinobacteria bacterium]|nr:EVE domain-containing protein [Actinomycetota bacterium]